MSAGMTCGMPVKLRARARPSAPRLSAEPREARVERAVAFGRQPHERAALGRAGRRRAWCAGRARACGAPFRPAPSGGRRNGSGFSTKASWRASMRRERARPRGIDGADLGRRSWRLRAAVGNRPPGRRSAERLLQRVPQLLRAGKTTVVQIAGRPCGCDRACTADQCRSACAGQYQRDSVCPRSDWQTV